MRAYEKAVSALSREITRRANTFNYSQYEENLSKRVKMVGRVVVKIKQDNGEKEYWGTSPDTAPSTLKGSQSIFIGS